MRSFIVLTLACLIVSCFLGCGDGNVRLGGKVTFSDTQEPLTRGEIHFSTPTFLARAIIQPDGTYTVGSLKEADGLPPGTYAIAVVHTMEGSGALASMVEQTVLDSRGLARTIAETPLIDPKYNNKETSGLSVTVDKSTKVFNFEVDRFQPRSR